MSTASTHKSGGGRENMAVLVIEIEYEEDFHKRSSDRAKDGV